jgi:putative transposase
LGDLQVDPFKRGTAVSKVSRLRVVAEDGVAELPDLSGEVRLALSEVAASAREGLLAMSVATGLKVMAAMMEAELAGPRGKHDPDRLVGRHGSARSSVTLGARRVPVIRPRVRSTDGQEVALSAFAAFTDDDLLAEAVMSRMLAGLAARRFTAGSEPVGREVSEQCRATSRSAVSRRFVKATETALGELLARDLSQLSVAAMMIDGLHIGDYLMVVALAITADGTKVPVGLYEGDTENTTVATGLLNDILERGLEATGEPLFVLDGAKALAKGVRKVFGDQALVQPVLFTSGATWPITCPSENASSSTPSSSGRSPTPIPNLAIGPPATWQPGSNGPTPRPRTRSGRA